MREQIEAILSGVRDKTIKQVGPYWQIRVGARAGARENGISLAQDLLREHREAGPPEPVQTGTDYDAITESLKTMATETVIERIVPDPEQAAKIAELEARLAEAEAALEEAHAPQPVQPDGPIPDELEDLISYADTPAQTSEKLLVRLREVLGLIGLAEDAGGRAAPELYRRRDRLESGIQWNRGRSAEVI